MPLITELARAKINLTLKVLGKRPDGYHELESLVAFADVGDGVTLDTEGPPGIAVEGPFAAAIEGTNIVDTALKRLLEREPRLRLGAVCIVKMLPVAAGLGGGSADAAAVLRAVMSANPEIAGGIDWLEIAASIGADVPVCFANVVAVMRGRGERLTPADPSPRLDIVLANPLAPVPKNKTAEVFGRLSARAFAAGASRRQKTDFATLEVLVEHMRAAGNDLEATAFSVTPEAALVKSELARADGCRIAQLSGAGPTCFGVFASHAEAAIAAEGMKAEHPRWWIEPAVIG